jgi:endonuclease-8
MRIVIETDAFHAVGFTIPVAELTSSQEVDRESPLQHIGPDPLAPDFNADEAFARIRARTDAEIADALLDQSAIAGIGNVYKSEVLFAAHVDPFTPVPLVSDEQIRSLVTIAARLMRMNAPSAVAMPYTAARRTTGNMDPSAALWVYGRAGKPCRRCGTPISRVKQGPHARSTYWCRRCQPASQHTGNPT